MPDFPSELVEAAAKALAAIDWTEREALDALLASDPMELRRFEGRAVAPVIEELVRADERDRLAKQAGEPRTFRADECQKWAAQDCVEMPCCGFTFAAGHLDHGDEDTYTCPQCSPGFACGVAAEREQTNAMQQAIDAAVSALRETAYVGGLTVEDAHQVALLHLGPLATEHKGAALSSPAEPDTEASNE